VTSIERAIFERGRRDEQLGFHRLDGVVDRLAGSRTFARSQRADGPAHGGDFAVAAEIRDASGIEFALVRRRGDGGSESFLKFVELCV
jgi:hypothetical protein